MKSDVLNIDGLGYRYPGASTPALTNVSCAIKAGECICLTGDSGCGKTTLLLAIKGLLRGGSHSGTIKIALPVSQDAWSVPVGLVFQKAESQILCTTVAEEVAFGPENLCAPPEEIDVRVRKALMSVGLDGCETRNVERFSAGQKQRLTIASVLSMNPSLLLLDEPTSQLDRQGKQELCTLLAGFKKQGYTIVMTEHDPRPFYHYYRPLSPHRGWQIRSPNVVLAGSRTLRIENRRQNGADWCNREGRRHSRP